MTTPTPKPRRQKTPIPKDRSGLSFWYRLTWRLEYLGVSFTGPGAQTLDRDPRELLRRERTRRVEAARAATAAKETSAS